MREYGTAFILTLSIDGDLAPTLGGKGKKFVSSAKFYNDLS